MVLSEQAMRSWKLVTAIATAGTAVHTTLYTDYAMPPHLHGRNHVFTDVQVWYRAWVDRTIWGLHDDDDSTST